MDPLIVISILLLLGVLTIAIRIGM